jgi:transcriptional regulator with XRE-family HTH domain
MSETTDLIKRLRASGLSQTEIARRSGIPQPRLSKWESGETPRVADDALKLAKLVQELDGAAGQPANARA